MSATKQAAEDAIAQILNQPAVGSFEIVQLSEDGNGEYSGKCEIKHSSRFSQMRYTSVNGFDKIKFNKLLSGDGDMVKYDFFLFETTTGL